MKVRLEVVWSWIFGSVRELLCVEFQIGREESRMMAGVRIGGHGGCVWNLLLCVDLGPIAVKR